MRMTNHVRISAALVSMVLLSCGGSTSSTGTGNGTGSGSGTGTATGTGNGTGTGTTAANGAGAACAKNEDCATGFDCRQGLQFPGGICSRNCISDSDCGSSGFCAGGQQGKFCVRGCKVTTAGDCGRDGYVCQPVDGTSGICVGDCNDYPGKNCGFAFLSCSSTLGICEGKVEAFGTCSISDSDPDLRQCKSGSICMTFEGQGNQVVGYCFHVFASERPAARAAARTTSAACAGPR